MKINFYNIANIDVAIEKCNIYKHVNNCFEANVPFGTYIVKIYRNRILLDRFVIYYSSRNCQFNYLYNPCNNNYRKILLTDYYYPKLKIERGLINLWHIA